MGTAVVPTPALPPGFTLDAPVQQGTPPLPAGFTLDAAEATQPPTDAQPDTWMNAIKNVGQAAAHVGSGLLSIPASGIAGLGAAATNALGLTNTPAADVVSKVGNALTFEPRTPRAQGVVQGVTYPLRKLGEFADTVGDSQLDVPKVNPVLERMGISGLVPNPANRGSAAVATGMNTLTQSLPALFMRGRAEAPKAAEMPKAPAIDPRAEVMAAAQKEGLKFTPTQAKAPVGSVAEGMTGQAKLERSLSLKNAPVVNTLAAKELGLADDAVLTTPKITELKVKANRAYSDVAKTGRRMISDDYRNEIKGIGDRTGGESFKGDTPQDITKLKDYYANLKAFTAEDAVNKIRQLRTESSSNIKARNAPEQNAKGYVQRQIADALDNELARHVETLGKPDLVQKYKDARVQLAKVYSVEDALRGGNVSAKALAQQLKRGAPLSGNLKLIAQTYGEFEKVLQDVSKVRDGHPFSVVDAFMGVAGAAHSPALVSAVLARPLVRAALASDRYQRGLAKPGTTATAPPRSSLARPAATNAIVSEERRRKVR